MRMLRLRLGRWLSCSFAWNGCVWVLCWVLLMGLVSPRTSWGTPVRGEGRQVAERMKAGALQRFLRRADENVVGRLAGFLGANGSAALFEALPVGDRIRFARGLEEAFYGDRGSVRGFLGEELRVGRERWGNGERLFELFRHGDLLSE